MNVYAVTITFRGSPTYSLPVEAPTPTAAERVALRFARREGCRGAVKQIVTEEAA